MWGVWLGTFISGRKKCILFYFLLRFFGGVLIFDFRHFHKCAQLNGVHSDFLIAFALQREPKGAGPGFKPRTYSVGRLPNQ